MLNSGLLVFSQTANPISTRKADYADHSTLSPLATALFGTILLLETLEEKDLVISKVNLTFIFVV